MEKGIITKNLLLLNALFLIYSAIGIFLKNASKFDFLSPHFLFFFVLAVVALVIYAIGWQLALRQTPLSSAYLNKSIVLIWGILWSVIFFHEAIDRGIVIGGCMIVLGILLVVKE